LDLLLLAALDHACHDRLQGDRSARKGFRAYIRPGPNSPVRPPIFEPGVPPRPDWPAIVPEGVQSLSLGLGLIHQ